VLYPAYLRDVMLRLAQVGMYQPLWSADILDELGRNLVEIGINKVAVDRTLAAMGIHFDDAEVVDYHGLIEAMTCDVKDRHVLAAAIRGEADFLVTFNTKDFPPASLASHAMGLITPDDFLLSLLDQAPGLVWRTLADQAARYKCEPKTIAGVLTALERGGVPRFVDEMRRFLV
jgi:predicted nucleic acid-binding protein